MFELANLSLHRLIESVHIGIVIHRWDTSIVYANPTALRLLKLNYQQIIDKDVYDPTWNFIDDAKHKLPVEDYPVNKVKRLKKRLINEVVGVIDGSQDEINWLLVNAYFEGDEEKDAFIVVTFNDITESRQTVSFEDIVENAQDIIIVTEAQDIEAPLGPKIVYVNKAFEKLTGYTAQEVIGETPRILQGTLTDKNCRKRIHKALTDKVPVLETILNYSKSGHPYWLEMNIIPLVNRYGEVTHFAAIERDVTEKRFHVEQLQKRNEDLKELKESLQELVNKRTKELVSANNQLEKLAFFDPLTEIPNRRQFIDQASSVIQYSHRNGQYVVFGLLDIDDFKQVNDEFGHETGDKVLIILAAALRKFFRKSDAFCRYGGEEFAFAVIVENKTNASLVCERLMQELRDLQRNPDKDCNLTDICNIEMTVSIGINVHLTESDTNLDAELKKADIALYKAKSLGKNRIEYFD